MNTKIKIISATLLVNPVSGKGDLKTRRARLKNFATAQGWKGRYRETTQKITAKQIALSEIKKGVTHLIVCGGDGTVREVIEAVVNQNIVVGIIPLGTGNLLARNLSIPLDTEKAMEVALVGNHRTIDIGRANGTYFSIIAGIGLDAEVIHSADREMKDTWGIGAYVVSTLHNLHNRSTRFIVTLDGKKPFTVRAKTIMASNMGKIMGDLEVVPGTDPQNGVLKLGIIKTRSLVSWINIFAHAVTGDISKSDHYEVYTAKNISIKTTQGKRFYQCDGEQYPKTDHLSLEIYPKAITVMVPPDVIDEVQKKNEKILLFDFDGTIADSLDMVVTIYNSFAKKYHLPTMTSKKKEELRGLSAREVISQITISKLLLPKIILEGKKEFARNLPLIKPFPELQRVMAELAKECRMGIVTSNDSTNVKQFLLSNNLDYFDFIYSDKSLFGKGKVIKNVLKKYNFKKEHVIYVGDEVRDIDAAREAGIKIASVTWGFNTRESLAKSKPDRLIDSPHDLKKLI